MVTENAQVFGERGLVGFGEFEQVDGAVEAGARVGGGAELHAQALERFHEGARLIMLAPVEGHGFEKMREAALVVLFVKRAGFDEQAEGLLPGGLVEEDRMVEAGGERAETDGGVGLEIGGLVGGGNRGGASEGREAEGR